jgi:hypothetical protein
MNPISEKPLIDKLGVKVDHRATVIGVDDAEFLAALESRCGAGSRRLRQETDILFFGAESRTDLARLAKLIPSLKQDGAVWVIYPKGVKPITEANVREAGIAAGLVDNKIVRFSATHTGLRFVIPVARRR